MFRFRKYGKITRTVLRALEKRTIKYEIADDGAILFVTSYDDADIPCQIVVEEKFETIHFFAGMPYDVGKEHLAAIDKWMSEVNSEIGMGTFFYSQECDRVTYRIVAPVMGGAANEKIILSCIALAASLVELRRPSFLEILGDTDSESQK